MISKIKNMGLSVPKRAEVIKDTFFVTAAIACAASVIFGIDSMVAGVMALISRM